MTTVQHGGGLFDLRDLQTETLLAIHLATAVGAKAETRLFSLVRRILLERGELS